jgi:hypothetical protein
MKRRGIAVTAVRGCGGDQTLVPMIGADQHALCARGAPSHSQPDSHPPARAGNAGVKRCHKRPERPISLNRWAERGNRRPTIQPKDAPTTSYAPDAPGTPFSEETIHPIERPIACPGRR